MNRSCNPIGSSDELKESDAKKWRKNGEEKVTGCMICGYQGDELAAGHIEHAHAVALVHARAFVEQQERHKRAIAVLSGQKKNAMIMGLTQENLRLRNELKMIKEGSA